MTIPVRRRQIDRTTLSDGRLKAAAVGLLVERGIAGTTLAAIGERAGYSRGLVTHRFGSKAGLLAYVHDTVAAEWIEHLKSIVGTSVGSEALERVVEALRGFVADFPNEIRAMCMLRFISIDASSEYRANVSKVHRAQQRDLQSWIERGQADGSVRRSVCAPLAAELFCSALDGVLYRWLVSPEIPIDELYQQLRREVRRTLRTANIKHHGNFHEQRNSTS
jgi:AcrR family transcriptional regulator